ncbi:hypothetical protein [Nonlabens xiamenensis]|uniref:hypothetical protein n=1 Tax=Nonlabens xiamenensis TaxID=2341043 RepID=UPI000F60978D|nr:hypothetical protein [Nonlabens xiamenensis]
MQAHKYIQPLLFVIAILSVMVIYILSLNHQFFWDTIQLGSLHATHFYQNNFADWLLPNRIDSGHIPAFGWYIAFWWKLFDRSLLTSHLAMLPFVVGILWQSHVLVKHFFQEVNPGIVYFLLVLDTALLSQMSLVSPDVPLVFFFLIAFNAILSNKKIVLACAIFLLFLTSMRGMMVSLLLLFIDVALHIQRDRGFKKIRVQLFNRSLIYLPALLLFLVFNYYHFKQTGWVGFHSDSPWASSFKTVGVTGILRNVVIYIWRLLDFGRVLGCILFVASSILLFKKIKSDYHGRILLISALIFLFLFPLNLIWASGLIGHRYVLPVNILITLSTAYFINLAGIKRQLKNLIFGVWAIVLISGNFWVYPDLIAQGWDSSLAHWPYYSLQKKSLDFLEDQKIEFSQVETFFPSHGYQDDFFLDGDLRLIDGFEGNKGYVIYSNINNITDEQYALLHSEAYTLMQTYKSSGIFVKIFRKQ